VNVRADGIAAVLGPLLRDVRVVAAALVDVDSGMVLDAWAAATESDDADMELTGARHAELMRGALELARAWPWTDDGGGGCELVVDADGGCRHLVRTVPDPHGDRLALSVVVTGSARLLDRVRRRLRSVSVDALTAGPSMTRRPGRSGWSFALPRPDVPATPDPAGGLAAAGSAHGGRPAQAVDLFGARVDPARPAGPAAPPGAGPAPGRPTAPFPGSAAPPGSPADGPGRRPVPWPAAAPPAAAGAARARRVPVLPAPREAGRPSPPVALPVARPPEPPPPRTR
jgi:hypothetical protein